jgi:hypothetical protein
MLTEALLSLLRLIVVAVLVSLITTPIIVRLIKRMTFAIRPIYRSNNGEREVYPPNHVHSIRTDGIYSEKLYGNPIPNLSNRYCYKKGENQPQIGVLKQPNAATVDKLSKVIHAVMLFYRSYYRHSTKVEKNPPRGRP